MARNIFLQNFPLRRFWLNLPLRLKVLIPMFISGGLLIAVDASLVGDTHQQRAERAAVESARLLVSQAAAARSHWPEGSSPPAVGTCSELVSMEAVDLEVSAGLEARNSARQAGGEGGEAWQVVQKRDRWVLEYAAAEKAAPGCMGCHADDRWTVGDRVGFVELTMPLAPYTEAVNAAQWRNRWALGMVYVVLVVWLGSAMHHSVARPIARVASTAEDMANGDLRTRFRVISSDEVGTIRGALNTMLDSLTEALDAIGQRSQAVTGASDDLSRLAQEMREVSESASAEAGSVSAASQQVSQEVGTVADASRQMNASTREIASSAAEASAVASEAVEMVGRTNSSMSKLGQSREEIGKVVQVIESVAAQTSLLALNATIEAARAGESGKGFAVVASEVKQLAAQTGDATREIAEKIEAIQVDAAEVVDAISGISMVIMRIHDLQNTIAASVEEQSATTAEIDRSAAYAAEQSSDIASRVTNLAASAHQASAQATSADDASQALAQMAMDLQQLIERFRVS